MTGPERQQDLRISLPSQARPPDLEAIVSWEPVTPEPLVANVSVWGGRTFAELVDLAQSGNSRVLGGYLDQRARTPAASKRELAAQIAVLRREPRDGQASTEIRCLRAARQADLLHLNARFLPDDLRPWYASPVLTAAALALIVQDSTYDTLAMQAREQRGEKVHKGERDFLRELGFYALGWAAKRVAWQRNALGRQH